jgi:hypothetical protein
MKTTIALLLAGIATAVAPALANDSTAELSTGGLIFVHNDNVEMRSEDLAISAKEIKVRYRFFNSSDKDVTVLVAFPMPEIRIDDSDTSIAIPTEDPVNLLGFSTVVDGKPVKTEVQQRALAVGIDRSDLLKSLGVPLAPHLETTSAALDQVPQDKWDELVRIGLVDLDEYDNGKGMERHLAPRWGLFTTYYWEQTFPSKKETVIEHKYQPSLGESVQTSLGDPAEAKEPWYEEYQQKYCIDKAFYAALDRARRAAKSPSGAPYSEERIDYILKTGANWSGPIQDFRLTVDKGDADALVSFCGEDIKKISATQMEMRGTDYTPDGDFSVLILRKLPPQ